MASTVRSLAGTVRATERVHAYSWDMRTKDMVVLLSGWWTIVGCRGIEPIEPPPELATLDDVALARVELGRDLFFEKGLSRDGTVACASCHVLEEGGDDGRKVSAGVEGQLGARNAPTVINVGLKQHLFWDGRADTLEHQAVIPLRAAAEMAADDGEVIAFLTASPRYAPAFARAFPGEAITVGNLAIAIASFERELVAPSRVDAFLSGDARALDAREQRGLDLFSGNCAFCHDGPGVGGQRLAELGAATPWPKERSADLGRFAITGDDADRLVFAVPQLRNVADTAPYFHDGSVETLEEAVRLMAEYQVGTTFTDGEIADLVAFLTALRGAPRPELLAPGTALR